MLTPRAPKSLAALPGARRAVAAMEFALLAPVMAILLIAVFNIAKILILWEQCWSAARSIAESATTLAVQSDGTNQLSFTQADEALSAVFAEIPWVTAGIATGTYTGPNRLPANTVKAVLSSIDYVSTTPGCTTACTYQPVVEWSKAYANTRAGFDTRAFRHCGPVAPGATPIPVSLGDAISVPDPFVIADVSITYTPWLFSAFLPNLTVAATAYVPVRGSPPNLPTSDGWLTLDDTGDPNTDSLCPNATVIG